MHIFWEESWSKYMKPSKTPEKMLQCHVHVFTVLLSVCLHALAFLCTLEIYLSFINT